MKNFIRVLGGSLFIGLLLLASLVATAGASSAKQSRLLPLSPYSGGYLMAQAIHSGKVRLPSSGAASNTANPNLTCTPAPCAFPNVVASEGTTNPVNEDPIVVNPNNAKQLETGGNDYNCASLQGFFTSSNGGTTWTRTCLNVLSGASGAGDPAVGYDLNGNVYAAGIDTGTADGSDIVFEKSSNNGTSWSAPAIAVRPFFSGGLTDKEWLQVDTTATSPHANALYISVTQFASNNNSTITVTHSYNGGSTWATTQVDTTQVFPSVDQFSDLAVGKDGTVYVSWMRCTANGPTGDCGGTKATFYISKSTNGGLTWSTPSVIETASLAPDSCGAFYGCLPNTGERVSNIPAIDVDNSSATTAGNLYVVTYNWTGTYMKVQVTTSTNGGSTWNKPVRVTPKTDTRDQFFPWLTVSKKGIVGVTWLDRRNDPSNLSYEAFASTSTNGTSFSANVQIASVASNPNNDGFGGGFMGDYTGNYWSGSKLYASWMDTRSGTASQDEVGGYLK
jgi:hypothetical protein